MCVRAQRLSFCNPEHKKNGHPLRIEDTYIWRALQGLSTETVYLRHSTNAEDTILAGRSQSSPLQFFVESIATDHQTELYNSLF